MERAGEADRDGCAAVGGRAGRRALGSWSLTRAPRRIILADHLVDLMRVLIAAFALVFACCKLRDRVGESCGMLTGTAGCKDGHTRIVCDQGKYIEEPCRGPKGCEEEEEPGGGALVLSHVACDVSDNRDGDRCGRPSGSGALRYGGEEDQGACSSDRRSIVICHDGRFERRSCHGPSGCLEQGSEIRCD